MAAEALLGEKLPPQDLEFEALRGMDGVKSVSVQLAGKEVRVGVVAGLGVARPLIEAAVRGENIGYDLVEIMACPGGCVGGAGNPRARSYEQIPARQQVLYDIDASAELRKSQDNVDIWGVYDDLLGKPGSDVAHHLLHTTYLAKPALGEEAKP
jgi:formate dehydrogenase major subunit